MIPRSANPRASGWIALGAASSGVSTYLLLVVVALGLDTEAFDDFSLYWAVLLIAVIGGFLPLEQIVARRCASGSPAGPLSRWAVVWGSCAAAVGTLVFATLSAASPGTGRQSLALVLVLAANLAATTGQSVLRGLAAGRGRLDGYALITTSDGVLRAALCGLLVVVGVGDVVAYAAAIAVGCWGSVLLGWRALRSHLPDMLERGAPGMTALSREALSLTPAMLAMQLLLNSPVPLASMHAGRGASAGAVLAISSLVRTSVFVMQAGQAAYVARIAASVGDGTGAARRVTVVVVAFTVALAAATAAGAGLLGPWLVGLLFGEDLVAGRPLCVAVGVGVGLFLLAIVANDLSVAWGVHRNAGWYWAAGALAAAGSLPLLPDHDYRVVVPLGIGSAVALVLTVLRPRAVDRTGGAGSPVLDGQTG